MSECHQNINLCLRVFRISLKMIYPAKVIFWTLVDRNCPMTEVPTHYYSYSISGDSNCNKLFCYIYLQWDLMLKFGCLNHILQRSRYIQFYPEIQINKIITEIWINLLLGNEMIRHWESRRIFKFQIINFAQIINFDT